MKIIYNQILPTKGFVAINIFGFVFARKKYAPLSLKTINHEAIHTVQMKETLYIFFYLWYGIEWFIRWLCYGFNSNKAYRNISFEREGYSNDSNLGYLKIRTNYSWIKYLST